MTNYPTVESIIDSFITIFSEPKNSVKSNNAIKSLAGYMDSCDEDTIISLADELKDSKEDVGNIFYEKLSKCIDEYINFNF